MTKLAEAGNGDAIAAAATSSPGGVQAFVECSVRGGTPRIKAMALNLIKCLAEASADARDALGKAGAIGPLVKLLATSSTPAEQRLAASQGGMRLI